MYFGFIFIGCYLRIAGVRILWIAFDALMINASKLLVVVVFADKPCAKRKHQNAATEFQKSNQLRN